MNSGKWNTKNINLDKLKAISHSKNDPDYLALREGNVVNKCINEDTDENEIVKWRNIHYTKIDNNDLIQIYNFYTSNKICAFCTQIIKEVQIERFHQLRNEGSLIQISWYECQFTTTFLKEIRGI